MITIYHPIFLKDNYARISVTDWAMEKEGDNIEVIVMNGNEIAGRGTINKDNWIKTAKLVEKKVKKRPNDPMTFYHNDLIFKSPEQLEREEYIKYHL